MRKQWIIRAGASLFLVTVAGAAQAQSSSLFLHDVPATNGAVLRLSDTSWSYRELPPPREIQLHDIITVIVEEKATVLSQGNVDRKKTAKLDAAIKDWVKLDGLGIKPAPQKDGDPKISASLDSQYKADSAVKASDALTFRIAAKILDIRPNGTVVIEGHRTLRVNEEDWELSLAGTVRKEDILPNNTVHSENIADLDLRKRETGDMRDGYRRGWLLKFYDKVAPF